MSRLSFAMVVLMLLVPALAGQARAAGPVDAVASELERLPHVPGELLVQWTPGASPANKGTARARIGGSRVERIVPERWRTPLDGGGELELLRLPPGLAVADAVGRIERDAAVEFAEPNWIYSHQAASNDPYYTNGNLWGMYGDASTPANKYGSQAAEAWAANGTDCSNVWVGIIDEGYMYAHADLAANAGTNPGEIAGNNLDDDGNGYVDDVFGWDFAGGNNTVFDGVADDHGTHVAGTIGAVGGNGAGVAGVCWQVKLMNAKFLGNAGGTTANAIRAVDYFTDLKTRHGIGLVATSNSWGGGGFSQGLMDAITRANAANILFVAAAGNSTYNCDVSACYPAAYSNPNVIAVAALDKNGALSSFSNYGATTIDLGAPGRAIYSTVPKRTQGVIISSYASYSGTSMATPHVSGAAALYAARNPGVTAAAIKAAILGATVPTPSLSGKTVTGGRLNVSNF